MVLIITSGSYLRGNSRGILGIIMGIIPLLLSLIPLFFQAIFWLARTAVQIVFYGLICGYLILEWIAKKIRKAIYSDEYEELHF
ncbi:hypothetical protein A4W72_11145 (plasmid) [Latilactobacillus curvatus]|nr:hypothetical protein A4W72_11145 [Latilactobacillus curvatus]